MRRCVELATLRRRELENLLLAEQGGLARILEVVRIGTAPQWKVRREVEQIVEEAVGRLQFLAACVRGVEADQARVRADRNVVRRGDRREIET